MAPSSVPNSQCPCTFLPNTPKFPLFPSERKHMVHFSPLDSGLPTFIVTLALPKVTHCASGVLCLDTCGMDAAGHRLRQGGENVDGMLNLACTTGMLNLACTIWHGCATKQEVDMGHCHDNYVNKFASIVPSHLTVSACSELH